MDMIKIGKFIAECRKEKNLTQLDLAEKLCVTDRAVSKWECGRSMPDSTIMLDLCELLEISVNELLSGGRLEMNDYDKQAELNLIELQKQKEESDKRLLKSEIIMSLAGLFLLFGLIFVSFNFIMQQWIKIILVISGFVVFIAIGLFALRIEQKAGYYECGNCHTRYVPNYFRVLIAPHMGRNRLMKCPNCGKSTYHKKHISK